MFCTKSLSADLTASGSISATDTVCSILDGDRDRACVGLRLRERGVPTWGIGLPRPSVVVAYVFSKPLVGELGLDLRGLTLLFRNGLRDLGASCRKPIVRLKLEWILESLNSMSLFAPSTRASWASSAFTRPSAPLSFNFKSYKWEASVSVSLGTWWCIKMRKCVTLLVPFYPQYVLRLKTVA